MNDNFPAIIPDELIAWGKTPEIAVHFPRPWAHEVEALIAKGELNPHDTRVLMARLEALCAAAVRAGRADLLGGIDTRTAEYLGITFTIFDGERKIEIGRGKRYTWGEMRAVLATEDPKSAIRAVDQAKDLLAEIFPGSRVTDVSDTAAGTSPACASCGTTTSRVMITTVYDTHHCGHCWSLLTDQAPVNYKHKTTSTRGKR